jgi:glutamate receptor, ionotropic, plant
MRDPKPHQITQNKQICLFFYIVIYILNPASAQPTQIKAPFKVGLIIDTNYPIGQIALTSIKIAIADFYTANPSSSKQLVVVQRDSSSNVLAAASSGRCLIFSRKT